MSLETTLFKNSFKTICYTLLLLFAFSCSSNNSDDFALSIPKKDSTPPTNPTNLKSTNVTETTTDLSWAASTDNVGVQNYSIFKDSSNIGFNASTSKTITDLEPNTTYIFKVRAKDSIGNTSGFSNRISVTTIAEDDSPSPLKSNDSIPPTTPTNLKAMNITRTTIDLNWVASTDNVGVQDYSIFKDGSSLEPNTTTSKTITGLEPNTTYTFKVQAKDSIGNISGFSNQVSVTTVAEDDSLPPTAPTSLEATNITRTTIDLNWAASTDNVGVQDYLIFENGSSLGPNVSTSKTITDLDPSSTYTFKVQAKDSIGNTSGFSNQVSVTTLSENSGALLEVGDIETYMSNIIDNVPGNSGNEYTVPTTNQLNIWSSVIDAILAEDIAEAVSRSSEVNYQIKEFTDTSLSPDQVFYILEEKSGQSNYWGTYVFSKTPTISNLILMAPHIKFDLNTGKQAAHCFKNNVARALFIAGTHRCNNSRPSPCSGTTSACGSSGTFRVSDMAHSTQSAFQKATEKVFNTISSSIFVQLHGFGKKSSDPHVILSNGTRETPVIDYATLIKDALLVQDNSLTFQLAHINTSWNRLLGFTNTQGRLINNSEDHCSKSATTTSGRFIHIEQERSKLRNDASGWAKMSNALGDVFN